jgi:hypothetical protein
MSRSNYSVLRRNIDIRREREEHRDSLLCDGAMIVMLFGMLTMCLYLLLTR